MAGQFEIAAQHVGSGAPLAGCGLGHPRGERGVTVDGKTDQGHTGMGGLELAVGLLDGEPRKRHEKISLGEFRSGSRVAEKTNKIS